MVRKILVQLREFFRRGDSGGGKDDAKVEIFLFLSWIILTALFLFIYSLFAKVTQNVFSYSTVIIFAAVLIFYLIVKHKR